MSKNNYLLKLNKRFLCVFVLCLLHILITGCTQKVSNVCFKESTTCLLPQEKVVSKGLKNNKNTFYRFLLNEAVALNDIKQIKKILKQQGLYKKKVLYMILKILGKKTVMNKKDSLDFTPLHVAAFSNSGKEIIEKLFLYETDVLETDADSNTALHWAVYTGNIPLIENLCEHKTDIINATNKSGNTPLTCAVEQRNLAAVEALLTAFKSLLKAGDVASLDATDTNGNTIFHLAAAIDDPAILKKLIEYIPEVSRKEVLNKKNSAGRMPIFSAIKRGYKDVTEVLIQSGADVNAESAYSATPLYFAVHCGNLAIVKLLLDYGAKPFAKLVNNNTAFQLAVSRGHKPIIRILIQQAVTKILEQDANVDAAVDSQRNTLLHLAAKEGHIEIAQMLITQGADKAVKNNSNATPLAYALSNIKDLKIQKKLLSVFDAKDLGECSICLDKLVPESSENMILLHGLDCGHIFHADCIAKSIENNIKTCPNCRAHIPK